MVTYAYLGLNWALQSVPRDMQWLMAFIIVLFRELNAWITSKMNKVITGEGNDFGIDMIGTHYAAIRHIMFVSVNLESITMRVAENF